MKTMNKLYLLQFDKFQCTINFLLWSPKDLIFKKIILPNLNHAIIQTFSMPLKKTKRNVWTTLIITHLHNRDIFNANSQFPIYQSSKSHHTIWKAKEPTSRFLIKLKK